MLVSIMINKKLFFIISSIIVLTPLLGALYLNHVVSRIETEYKSKYDVEEVIEIIEGAEDIEALKKISLYAYMANMKVIEVQYKYIYQYILILILLAGINLTFLITLYIKINNNNFKATQTKI
jgi:hypothetical protein